MPDGTYSQRQTPLSPSALASLVSTEIENCDNDFKSEIVGNATDAYNYFLLKTKGDEEAGKSQVQDGSVADVIDAVMGELQPMYTVDELIEVKAEGPDDEDQAKAETKALNWYFRERLRGYERLDEGVQDALLCRNGYLKIWPETSWRLPYEQTLEGTRDQVEQELAALIQQGAQVKEYSRIVLQEAQYAVAMVPDETGLELMPVQQMVSPEFVRVEVQVIQKSKEVKAATIAREDFGTSQDAVDQNLQKPRFSYNRRRMTRDEAVSLGFYDKDIYNLEAEDNTVNQIDNEREEGIRRNNDSHAADKGGGIVSIYECWYKVDADGDGLAELHQIYYGRTNTILRWAGPDGEAGPYADEIVRVVPVASGVALRVAHRHLGRSLFDKLRNTEDIRRVLKRQMNDNLYQANDVEFILGPGASEDDFELGFSGGYKRCQDVGQVRQIDYNPIVNESLQALSYYDSVVSDRGGAALDSANQQQPVNVQARTFERWMSATERTSAMYIRNIANSMIRDAFVLLHMALKTLGEEFNYQDGDEWKKAQPRYWMDRERFSVKLGKSQGERERMVASYEGELDKASAAMQAGGDGVLIDWSGIYNMKSDQCDLMGIDNHWLDPDRVVGQDPQTGQPITAVERAQQMQAQAAQEQQAAQERAQDKLLAAQGQIVALQEETKRLADIAQAQSKAQELVQKSLDSIRDFVNKQTELEVESGEDIAGGVLYGDEDLEGRVTQ